MEDGDRWCEYNDGDVEDLSLNDLIQLAKLDPNYNNDNSVDSMSTTTNKSNRMLRGKSIATTNKKVGGNKRVHW